MPMLPGYEAVREVVARTITDAKLELVWLEDLLEDWEWLNWLFASVSQCDFVVADPSEHNAFVMYELGVVRPAGRPTLLMLSSEDSQLSGSLDGSPFLLYSKAKLEEFSDRLRADLCMLASAVRSQAEPVLDPPKRFRTAKRLMESFTHGNGRSFEEVGEDAFNARMIHSMNHGTFIPGLEGTPLGDAALLAALTKSSRMVSTMAAIREWVYRNNTQD
jgi:hypothetical protein